MLFRRRLVSSIALLAFAGPSGHAAEAAQAPDPSGLTLRLLPQSESVAPLLFWEDSSPTSPNEIYEIRDFDRMLATTPGRSWSASDLPLQSKHRFIVRRMGRGESSQQSNGIDSITPARGLRLDVKDFGATSGSASLCTKAIQAAIDACPRGGVVVIPPGRYLSGALFLKSEMCLDIERGATLQGSSNPEDYLPMIRNRFEGWEMDTYASLINGGRLDHQGPADLHHVTIAGAGNIIGGGEELASRMVTPSGLRSRARLICLMNGENIMISGLHLSGSPGWTVHYIYCRNVTCYKLDISSTVKNGDGIDPDSSENSYIIQCRFNTNDDCIAVKSGKNPEGNVINRPVRGLRVADCDFAAGHGISIGSEMSGGVEDVRVQHCRAGNLINGFQIKGTRERGGYVRNIMVEDCQLEKIRILTRLNYNNDGAAAPTVPEFKDIIFNRIGMSAAQAGEPGILASGFDANHPIRNVVFKNIRLAEGAGIQLTAVARVKLQNVSTVKGGKPPLTVTQSEAVELTEN